MPKANDVAVEQISVARAEMAGSNLYNEDLAPTLLPQRKWSMWNIAALWVGMSVCIPTYMLAAGLINAGMSWQQALFTIILGNLIVLVPMVLNAHAGTKYGIPFPVLLRASFGTIGSNIAAIMRAIVACGWFGIQTWIGGSAIYALLGVLFGLRPGIDDTVISWLGISLPQFSCFMLFWAVNVAIILAGIESIRWLETLAAPFLLLVGVGLLFWAIDGAGSLGVILSDDTVAKIKATAGGESVSFWKIFFPNLTAMVGFWATLSLNIPDFTRFARSQKDQVLGQVIGLPTTMGIYSFIGIAVTSATVLIFGEAIWDPVALLAKFDAPVTVILSLVSITIATLTTNIAANVVSPANDFSNVRPSLISFKAGGIITAIIGILIMPWRLLADLGNYIFVWLIGYSALLGPIGGIMIADYYLLRRARLKVEDLYSRSGEYTYKSGINWKAVVVLVLAILPNVPGFINAATGKSIFPAFFDTIYTYAWFVGLPLAAGLYYVVMRKTVKSN
jgi:NCS1 family nucleobase:cation symporter-1